MGIYSNTRAGLTRFATGRHNIFCVFRQEQTVVPRTYSAVTPIAHKISPNHELQLFDSVVLAFLAAAVKQFPLHSCPHNFAPGIIISSIASPGTLTSKQSKIADTYSLPFSALISVMSVTHFSQGFSEKKSRFSKSSDFRASLSDLVIPLGFRFGLCVILISLITR